MADVKWARDERLERAKKMRCIIRAKRSMRDIQTDTALSGKLNITKSTFSSKMKSGAWTASDLKALDKVLRFSAEELAELVRC